MIYQELSSKPYFLFLHSWTAPSITTPHLFVWHLSHVNFAKDSLVHRISSQESPIIPYSDKSKTLSVRQASATTAAACFLMNSKDKFSYVYIDAGADQFHVQCHETDPRSYPSKTFTFSKEQPKYGEISVFGADKYFNAIKPDHMKIQQVPSNLPCVGSDLPSRLFSETSGWKSRGTLIHLQQNESLEPKRIPSRRSYWFPGFCCKGSCFKAFTSKLNGTAADQLTRNPKNSIPKKVELVEESRTSIEVFGSGIMAKGDVAANMERNLSMLTWDAIPKGSHSFPGAPATVRSCTICDDMASDASSDLFEIENISGSIYPVLAAAADGGASGYTSPASCDTTSEASFQWSVITASAGDYSSVLSDY